MRAELQTRMENTPKYLKDPEWVGGSDEGSAVRGMQRANVLVTEASIEFALVSEGSKRAGSILGGPSHQLAFAEDLETNAAVAAEERARIGRNTFEVLSSLPLDDLAANGESMVSVPSLASTSASTPATKLRHSEARSSGSCWRCYAETIRKSGSISYTTGAIWSVPSILLSNSQPLTISTRAFSTFSSP
jgi:hypothetical protein